MSTTVNIQEIKSRIEQVDPREVKDLHDAGAFANGAAGEAALIDTREPHEFDTGYIPGAKLVPPALVEAEIAALVPNRDQRLIVYCATGNRSAVAVDALERLGYQNAASMIGGIKLWRDLAYPTVEPQGLGAEQRERYSRHLLIPEIGLEGQLKLLNAKVLLVGAGGLGSPIALYLAAAGVGTLGIVDDDLVDASNLQRQVIHTTERIGTPKTASAKATIGALNPDVNVVEHRLRLDSSNILEIMREYDVVVDGTDNFPTRYLLNDASVRLGKPVVSASILGFDGQISVFIPHEGPCYRCLYPTPPPAELAPTCGDNGVLGILPGVMGLLQANEVVKLIVGAGRPLAGRLLLFEALSTQFTELKVRRDPACAVCGEDAPEIPEDELGQFPDYEAFCAVPV